MKKCPFCFEDIQDQAVKCKHCLEFIDETRRPLAQQPPQLRQVPSDSLAWYFKPAFMIGTFITLPPFVLPSVWLHPKLHWIWKILITGVVIGFCYLTYHAIQSLIKSFDQANEMLRQMQ